MVNAVPPSLLLLNVNDEPARRHVVSRCASDAGFQVIEAGTGREALRRVAAEGPAVVLLDVRLPDMDGVEVCRHIKATEPTTQVLLYSVYFNEDEDKLRGLEVADGYLQEPLNPRVVTATLRALARARRAEQAVRSAEAGQQFLFEALPLPAWVFDHDSLMLVHVNAAAVKFFGYSQDELLSMSVLDLGCPQDREVTRAVVTAQHGDTTGAWRLQTSDGRRRDVELFARLWSRAGRRLSLVVAEDLTEQKAAEEARRRTEAPLAALFELTSVGIAEDEPVTRRLVRVNPAVSVITGYSERELLSMTVEDLTHPDLRERDRDLFQRQLASGLNTYEIDTRYRCKDGRTAWVRVTGTVLRDRDGHPVRVFAVITDVTQHRQAEEALRAADRRKDEFLAMLGHELRNPLGAIMSAVAVLERAGDDSVLVARTLDLFKRQGTHLRRLVDDLLDVARVTSRTIALERELVDMGAVAERCVGLLQDAARAAGQEVGLDRVAAWVHGDATRLEQIISNLLRNAVACTGRGGRITVRVSAEGEEAVVRVIDTGIGIAPDVLPRIFDLFARGPRPADRRDGGLGIGLTLVRELTELHGGRVEAESDGTGKGSRFTVRLPRVAPPSPAGAAAGPAATAGTRRCVLIVEDNDDTRAALQALLELEGHAVLTADSGRAALAVLPVERPEVAVIDIGLPDVDGYELAARVRALGLGTRLVALTGYGQREHRERALEAGFDAHLVKPVEPEQLFRALEGGLR